MLFFAIAGIKSPFDYLIQIDLDCLFLIGRIFQLISMTLEGIFMSLVIVKVKD